MVVVCKEQGAEAGVLIAEARAQQVVVKAQFAIRQHLAQGKTFPGSFAHLTQAIAHVLVALSPVLSGAGFQRGVQAALHHQATRRDQAKGETITAIAARTKSQGTRCLAKVFMFQAPVVSGVVSVGVAGGCGVAALLRGRTMPRWEEYLPPFARLAW